MIRIKEAPMEPAEFITVYFYKQDAPNGSGGINKAVDLYYRPQPFINEN
ncbi:MAG: hypothetical protein ACR2KX_16820 [Chitinophagaceae bacterium]